MTRQGIINFMELFDFDYTHEDKSVRTGGKTLLHFAHVEGTNPWDSDISIPLSSTKAEIALKISMFHRNAGYRQGVRDKQKSILKQLGL